MAALLIGSQLFGVFDLPGTQGVQMYIADELKKVGLLFAQERLVTILKQVSVASVAPVKLLGIAGQEPAHDCANGHHPCP